MMYLLEASSMDHLGLYGQTNKFVCCMTTVSALRLMVLFKLNTCAPERNCVLYDYRVCFAVDGAI